MTAFDPARPRCTLPFAGKDYELLGTFALIEAVEYALKSNIGTVAVQVVNGMPVSDLAKLVATVLTSCGHKTSAAEAAGLLWTDVGLTGEALDALRLHLYSFLAVCLAPPSKREAKAKDMGELIGGLTDSSPGGPTAASV